MLLTIDNIDMQVYNFNVIKIICLRSNLDARIIRKKD